jgi:tripartite-type tricarboxylate transporter receptor subunit TctC
VKTSLCERGTGVPPRRKVILASAALAVLAFASHVQAQEWPARPIRVVTPFAAGGVGENMFRIIAPLLEARLGQPFVIEARTGAGGNIGTGEVVRAAPDGYTLLLGTTATFSANQFMYKNIGFDPITQLEPVMAFAKAVPIAFASKGAGVKTLQELAAKVKMPGAKYNYGSPGAGSVTHLMGAWFSLANGNTMEHIAYRGTPPMVQAILTNEVQLAFGTLGPIAAHLRAGNLVPLAVMDARRIPELPDVPSIVEAGYPDQIFTSWWAIAAPRGTDPRIVSRLAAEIRRAMAQPGVSAKFAELGHQPMDMSPQESALLFKSEAARYKSLIERSGVAIE